jgi:RHS repeat-associated protein
VAYDAAGSEVSDDVNTMAYGARELLGSAGQNVSAYAYDGFRRRVQAQMAGGQQRVSLYDGGDQLLAESSSTTPASIANEYVWFGNRPVAQFDANATHWSFADHLGTPLIQTDATASISWQAEYEPFGAVFSLRAGDVHQPLRLPGQEAQQFDTGANGINELSYNHARWYRPGWGRYTQSDPIGVSGDVNLYAYAGDAPDMAIDPSGLCLIKVYYHQIEDGGIFTAMANHGILRVTDNNGGSTDRMYDAEPSNGARFYNYGLVKADPYVWSDREGKAPDIRGAIYRSAAHFKDRGPLTVVNNSLPCDCYVKRLDATTNALNAAHLEYDPFAIDPWSGNSNSALYEWLKSIGAESKPTGWFNHPWIPGYHAVL